MTAYSKTYAAEVWDLATMAALLLALLALHPTDTVTGLVVLAGFVAVCWRVGMTLGRWTADRDVIRRVRQEADQLSQPVPASVEDHYSGPRKITRVAGGPEVIMTAPTDGSKPRMVHNHGPHEGRGLECPEYGEKDGTLRGACVIEEARQRRTMKETNR